MCSSPRAQDSTQATSCRSALQETGRLFVLRLGRFPVRELGQMAGHSHADDAQRQPTGGRGHHLSFHDENNLFPCPKHKKPCHSRHPLPLAPFVVISTPPLSDRPGTCHPGTPHSTTIFGPGARPSLCLRTRTVPPRRTCPDKATYQRDPPALALFCVVSRRCCGEAQH